MAYCLLGQPVSCSFPPPLLLHSLQCYCLKAVVRALKVVFDFENDGASRCVCVGFT